MKVASNHSFDEKLSKITAELSIQRVDFRVVKIKYSTEHSKKLNINYIAILIFVLGST